jgi:hypothetical protein
VSAAGLVLRVLGLTALACACAGGGGVPGEVLNDPITERLVMAPYPAATPWKQVSDRHTRGGSIAVWVPAGQDLEHARDLLTRQVILGRGKVAPSDLASELAKAYTERCPDARVGGPRRGTEDGNDVAYTEVSCSLQQLVLLKVIRGHEALYAAQREFRREPEAAALREANAYLAEQVYLCPVIGGTGRCEHLPSVFE